MRFKIRKANLKITEREAKLFIIIFLRKNGKNDP